MAGEHCTSGCKTRDHATFAECMRAKAVGNIMLGGYRSDSHSQQRRFERDTDTYRDIVNKGGSMSTAVNKGVDAAYAEIESR